MNKSILVTIESIADTKINFDRQKVLQPLIDFISDKRKKNETINLNFICTHNSRRSHLSQIWAQTMAFHFSVRNVNCFSGGTEATAMFSKINETLEHQGFTIQKLSQSDNPIFAVKYDQNSHPIICFSKTFDDLFNPNSDFAAIMTCSSADDACPFISGAEKRIPIRYDDPKLFDGTSLMDEKYAERSLEIAAEMFYVFKTVQDGQ